MKDTFLEGEGFATLNNVAVQREILANTGEDIHVASAHPLINIPQYENIFESYVSGESAFAAAVQIGNIYRSNETPGGDQSVPHGMPFSTNGPYGVYYFNGFLNQVVNMGGKK